MVVSTIRVPSQGPYDKGSPTVLGGGGGGDFRGRPIFVKSPNRA